MITLALSMALAADGLVPVRGMLFDSAGLPVNGTRTVVFSLWHDDAAGTPFWDDDLVVSLEDGLFLAQLGSDRTLDLAILGGHPNASFSMRIVGDVDSERVAVGWAPRAGWAHDAGHLGGRPPEDYRLAEDTVDWDEISDKPDFAGTYLPLAGGAMTGALSLSGAPTSATHAATKAYVDDAVSPYLTSALATTTYLPLAGGSLAGALTLPGAPTAANHAATKAYVDGAISPYLTSVLASSTYLPLGGGTLTGALTLPGDPTAANHAATKAYVDGAISPYLTSALASSTYLSKSGGALTGALTLSGAPTASNHAATKAYVDSAVGSGAYLPLAGGTLTGTLNGVGAAFSGGVSVAGNLGVGTTSPGAKLDVNGNLNVDGYVKTDHPWFSVTATDCWRTAPNGGWTEVGWDRVASGNSGGWLNTGNGRFTAPVTGLYMFTLNFYHHSNAGATSSYIHYGIGVNGGRVTGGGQGQDGTYTIMSNNQGNYDGSTSFSRLMIVNQGDYVSAHAYSGGGAGYYMCGYHSLFQGVLVTPL